MEPVVTEKHEFVFRDESMSAIFLEVLGCSDSGIKVIDFSVDFFATIIVLSTELLTEGIEILVLEYNENEYRGK